MRVSNERYLSRGLIHTSGALRRTKSTRSNCQVRQMVQRGSVAQEFISRLVFDDAVRATVGSYMCFFFNGAVTGSAVRTGNWRIAIWIGLVINSICFLCFPLTVSLTAALCGLPIIVLGYFSRWNPTGIKASPGSDNKPSI